jgi:DNA primase large subunit
MKLESLARYPFLPESSAYLKERGITLDALVGSAIYEPARHAGRRRVMEALADGIIQERALTGEADCLVELLSYAVARIIVSCYADPVLIQRYAMAEAMATEERLKSEKLDFIIDMAVFMGMDVLQDNAAEASIHFTDYLKHSSQIRADEWKLVNKGLDGGRLHVSGIELARLMRNAVDEKIVSELPLPVNDTIEESFRNSIDLVREEVERRKAKFEKESYGKVSFLRLPPCMKRLMSMMKKGENVPHVGRFALTSFLHTIGMSNDEILAVFSSSPDFKEQLARYQIDHITGKSSGVEYLPPECATMKTQGICFDPDSLCRRKWLHHPLNYYRVKGKKRQKPAGNKTAEETISSDGQ